MEPAPEHARVEMKLPDDSRALPALEAAIEFLARRVGIPGDRQKSFALAAAEACRAAFARAGDGALRVTIEEFEDRVEVCLEQRGAGLAELAAKVSGALERSSSVRGEKAEGVSRLVLVARVSAVG
jgi:anti-sigma regulatory factor (Ser/Thr protein kinase)